MERLDARAIALPGVHFYRRYVDDIIMVCNNRRHSKEYIKDWRPSFQVSWSSIPRPINVISLNYTRRIRMVASTI